SSAAGRRHRNSPERRASTPMPATSAEEHTWSGADFGPRPTRGLGWVTIRRVALLVRRTWSYSVRRHVNRGVGGAGSATDHSQKEVRASARSGRTTTMGIGRKSAAAAIAVLALSLAACGGGGTPSNEPTVGASELATEAQWNPQPRENIKDGGTLTLDAPEISPQFNTWQADGTLYTLNVWRWYNPVLALFSPDGTWEPNPDYLTDVKKEEKDGNTVVTYTIRPEATYNDGTPIDWRSFEAVWRTSSGENEEFLVSSTDGYSQIKSVTKGADDKQ